VTAAPIHPPAGRLRPGHQGPRRHAGHAETASPRRTPQAARTAASSVWKGAATGVDARWPSADRTTGVLAERNPPATAGSSGARRTATVSVRGGPPGGRPARAWSASGHSSSISGMPSSPESRPHTPSVPQAWLAGQSSFEVHRQLHAPSQSPCLRCAFIACAWRERCRCLGPFDWSYLTSFHESPVNPCYTPNAAAEVKATLGSDLSAATVAKRHGRCQLGIACFLLPAAPKR